MFNLLPRTDNTYATRELRLQTLTQNIQAAGELYLQMLTIPQ